MNVVRAVLIKELKDGLRDRRALLSAFLFPLFAPVFIYGLMTLVIKQNTESEDLVLPVIGQDYAPALMRQFEEAGFTLEAFDGSPEAAVRDKTVELVVQVPEDYQETMANFELTRVLVINDGSRNDTRTIVRKVRNLISNYNNELAALRLIARGVSPKIMQGVRAKSSDVASDEQRAANLLNFIPIYVLMAAFVCGLGLAIDNTAGERERRSLEPLLINPVTRTALIFGKWLAASALAGAGMIITLALCLAAMLALPIDELGLNFTLTAGQVLMLLIAILPVLMFASSLQLLLGLFAKSFKDAQSYVGILIFIPVVPTLVMQFLPIASSLWMYFVPIFGQSLMIKEILGAETIPRLAYPAAFITTFATSLLVCWITGRLLNQERVIQS